jgi:hypothetical protein
MFDIETAGHYGVIKKVSFSVLYDNDNIKNFLLLLNTLDDHKKLKQIMALDTPKGSHNGFFDVTTLQNHGVFVKNYKFCTLEMYHMMHKGFPADISSAINLYYKNFREWKQIKSQDNDLYCAYDAYAALMLFQALLKNISEEKIQEYANKIKTFNTCLLLNESGDKLVRMIVSNEKDVENKETFLRKIIKNPTFNVVSSRDVERLFRSIGVNYLSYNEANLIKAQKKGAVANLLSLKILELKKLKSEDSKRKNQIDLGWLVLGFHWAKMKQVDSPIHLYRHKKWKSARTYKITETHGENFETLIERALDELHYKI